MKENKGITLIALVITIIVLIILAGISIAMLTGENGILTKASQSKENHEIGEEKEFIKLARNAVLSNKLGDTTLSAQELQEELDKTAGIGKTTVTGDNILKVNYTDSNRDYLVIGGKVVDEIPNIDDATTNDEKFELIEALMSDTMVFTCHDIIGDSGEFIKPNSTKHFNSLGKAKAGNPASDEISNEVYKVYKKAEEMGLLQIYENTEKKDLFVVPINEPCVAYYEFYVNNDDVIPGKYVPLQLSGNFEVRLSSIPRWADLTFPDYGTGQGDYETCLMWLGNDNANLGYAVSQARTVKFANQITLLDLYDSGQRFNNRWTILSQENFKKAATELGMDLNQFDFLSK